MDSEGVVVWILMAALFLSNLIAIGNIDDAGRKKICSGILLAIIVIYLAYEAFL